MWVVGETFFVKVTIPGILIKHFQNNNGLLARTTARLVQGK